MASGSCSSCDGRGGPAADLVQYVGRLDPIGWHGDRPVMHEDLHCFLSPWQDLLGATVGGIQCSARCVLPEENMHALLEVAVHECIWGGMACCRNRFEVGHMLAELSDEVHWIHWVSSTPGILRGSPYRSSATDACRFSLNAMWIPCGTRGSASVHYRSAWHMMAAFSVLCKCAMSVSCWVVVHESWMPQSLAREWKSWDSNWRPWSVITVCGRLKWDIQPVSRPLVTVLAEMSRMGTTSGQRVIHQLQ
jgi:hypothetical protein